MSILSIQQLSKRKENILLLPEINLNITSGQCVVIQCNNHLGYLLIQLILGDIPASNGQVLFEGTNLQSQLKKHLSKIGISLLHEGLYERLTVKDYLQFYKDLYAAKQNISAVLQKVGLLDHQYNKISMLSFSEQKRLQLGRAIIHNPSLLILEEPEQNIDIESQMIMRALLAELSEKGTAILITTSYLADAISITNDVYRLNEHEFKRIDVIDESDAVEVSTPADLIIKDEVDHAELSNHSIPLVESEDADSSLPTEQLSTAKVQQQEAIVQVEVQPVRVDKIPAKVDDKIILFDPTEINFIESSDGVSYLNVKGETFPSTFTLNELELKLKAFGFFRCHRSYIVNLQKVREVITWTRNSFSLILDDQKKSSIPLSKSKQDELKAILGI